MSGKRLQWGRRLPRSSRAGQLAAPLLTAAPRQPLSAHFREAAPHARDATLVVPLLLVVQDRGCAADAGRLDRHFAN